MFSSLVLKHSIDCATTSNIRGKTALHWAAAHSGEWLRRWRAGGILRLPEFLANAQSYSTLATQLIVVGADVHAIWQDPAFYNNSINGKESSSCTEEAEVEIIDFSPLMSFLRGTSHGTSLMWLSCERTWDEAGLADAVLKWGQMVVRSGRFIVEYVAAENEVLRSQRLIVKGSKVWSFCPVELVSSEETLLAVRVVDVTKSAVWKAEPLPTPGAWPASSRLPQTVIWEPCTIDDQYAFRWRLTDIVHIGSDAWLVLRNGVIDPQHRSLLDFEDARYKLLKCAQDERWLDIKCLHEESGIRCTNTKSSPCRIMPTFQKKSGIPMFHVPSHLLDGRHSQIPPWLTLASILGWSFQ